MENKNFYFFTVVFLLIVTIVVMGVIMLNSNSGDSTKQASNDNLIGNSTSQANSQDNSIDSSDNANFTLAQISEKSTIEDCLVVYNGNVYKIPTNFPQLHPGGAGNIINSCGKDITRNFENSHNAGNSAFGQIAEFKVGVLAN